MSDGSEAAGGASSDVRRLFDSGGTFVRETVLGSLLWALQIVLLPLVWALSPFARAYNYLLGRYFGRANGLQLFFIFAVLLALLTAPSWDWNFFPPFTLVIDPLDWFVGTIGLDGWARPLQLRYLGIACIWAIFAMAWDIQSGYTGYISFGHSVLSGAAGYTAAMLINHVDNPLVTGGGNEFALFVGVGVLVALAVAVPLYRQDRPVAAGVAFAGIALAAVVFAVLGHPLVTTSLRTTLLAILAAVAVGLLIAGPSLRLRGPYFSLITFVAVLLFYRFTLAFSNWTNGLRGLRVDVWTYDPALRYLYVLAPMLLVALVLTFVSRSNVGRVFVAIRENEQAVSAAGLDATKFKIWSFVLSSIPMGIGGVLLARYNGGVNPADFVEVSNSIEMIAMAVIGGMSSVLGAIGGAFLFIFLERDFLVNFLHVGEGLHWLALWILVLGVIVFARVGLFRLVWHLLGELGSGRE